MFYKLFVIPLSKTRHFWLEIRQHRVSLILWAETGRVRHNDGWLPTHRIAWHGGFVYPWPSARKLHRAFTGVRESMEQRDREQKATAMHKLGCSARVTLKTTGIDISAWDPVPWDCTAPAPKVIA